MSHPIESMALARVTSRVISRQSLTLRLCACVVVSLFLSAVWVYAFANPTDKPATVAQPVAKPSVLPVNIVPTLDPASAKEVKPQVAVANKLEKPILVEQPQTTDTGIVAASVSSQGNNEDFN